MNYRKLIVLITLLFLVQITVSQNFQTVEDLNNACSQLGFAGDEDAEIAVDKILDQIGLFKNFTIQECPNINNAVAKNIDIGSGKKERFILYDSEFFKRIDDKASNDWAAISVLAHEIGHHLNGHALNDEGSNHKWELEADEFSGFVLARMGASLDDAQSAINTLKYEKATRTHPAKADRLNVIATGWSRGGGKIIAVKKITEDVKKVIVENINEDEVIGEITAQQVLGNYIDAIGGQDAIIGVKTMIRNSEMTSTSYANDTKTVSTITSKMKYLTPSKFISSTEMSTGYSSKSMFLDAKLYIQKSSGKWAMSESKAMANAFKGGSYVPEYLYLVNNKNLDFQGVKRINGKRYYIIKLPATTSETDIKGVSKIETTVTNINYYDVDSGLLYLTETTSISKVDYTDNNEYLKDGTTTYLMNTIYSDYRDVNGIMFSFKQIMKTEMEISGKKYITETIIAYEDILVNPIIDPAEFSLENKEIFNQDEETNNIMDGSKYFSEGNALTIKNKCSEGLEKFKKSAEYGFVASQTILAQLYDNTYYFCKSAIEKNYEQALFWYNKAAEQGDHASLKKLGDIYEKGDYGVERNKEKALRYYLKSTRSLLWNMVDPAILKSIKSLNKSVDLTGPELEYINALQRMNKGDKEGMETSLLRSAEGGYVDAQVAMGYVYLMKQELKERKKWLKKAMDQGDKQAELLLNQL